MSVSTNLDSKKVNEILPKSIFGISKIYKQAIFDSIISERASRRQGTHKVKNRSEVSGTGKKPWAQKGTGRARAGTLRSNIFIGGGNAFGPKPNRNYKLKINKKVKRLAFKSALTLKAKKKKIIVHDLNLNKPSTKTLLEQIKVLNLPNKRILIITENENVYKSLRNVPYLDSCKLNSLTIEKIIVSNFIIFSQKHIKILEDQK